MALAIRQPGLVLTGPPVHDPMSVGWALPREDQAAGATVCSQAIPLNPSSPVSGSPDCEWGLKWELWRYLPGEQGIEGSSPSSGWFGPDHDATVWCPDLFAGCREGCLLFQFVPTRARKKPGLNVLAMGRIADSGMGAQTNIAAARSDDGSDCPACPGGNDQDTIRIMRSSPSILPGSAPITMLSSGLKIKFRSRMRSSSASRSCP